MSLDDSMDDEPEKKPTFLYTDVTLAVSVHPRIAVRKVAHVLGLDFEKINDLMKRHADRKELKEATKRHTKDVARQRSMAAFRKEQAEEREEDAREQERVRKMPRRPRVERSSSFTGFEEEIGWDVNPNNSPRPHAVIEDAPHVKAMALRLSQLPSHALEPPPRSGQAPRKDEEELSDAASEGSTVPDSLFSG